MCLLGYIPCPTALPSVNIFSSSGFHNPGWQLLSQEQGKIWRNFSFFFPSFLLFFLLHPTGQQQTPVPFWREVQRTKIASIPWCTALFANLAAASFWAPWKFPHWFNSTEKHLFTALSFFFAVLKPASSPSNSVKMQWLNITSQPSNQHGHWIMTYFQVTAEAASLML